MISIADRLGLTSASRESKRFSGLDRFVSEARSREDRLVDSEESDLRKRFERLRLEVMKSSKEAMVAAEDEMLVAAAALGAAAIRRVMGFRLHDVQVKGALATAKGAIIEMQTGEGKTMVCGLAALIRSVFDQSVHVATTNAYLAERDHATVKPAFELLGTTSAFIGPDSEPPEIRSAYRQNITYAPGYMFGFDYLRDQLVLRKYEELTLGRDVLERINGTDVVDDLSQTGHFSIIVDEADSVLIDESTTPLLLSGPSQRPSEAVAEPYLRALESRGKLVEDEDYTIEHKKKIVELTGKGLDLIHEHLRAYGRMDLNQPWPKYIQNAIYADEILLRDENYVVDDDKIKLVDQNTGRIFDDRSLRAGLHQAIEAKEGVTINPPNETMARVTRQRFFQLYEMVCGMTGTATGSEAELNHFYGTTVVPLPPNRPNKRIEFPDRFFKDWDTKVMAIVQDIVARRDTKQPILVGTRTIAESVRVQEALEAAGVECNVLNGIQDEDEAAIVARAGRPGSVCIATNMAGRGTDIKLTDESREAGGLHVIGAQRLESRRVDRQLAGRSARQGDPGSCQFFISSDDQLLELNSPALARQIFKAAKSEGESSVDFSEQIRQLQGAIEKQKFRQRLTLVQQDNWMDLVRETMVGS